MIDKKEGKIQVKVIDTNRLKAITEMAQAINKLASALHAVPFVTVTNCIFNGPEVGVVIDTDLDTTESEEVIFDG